MSKSRREPGIQDASDRTGPECREMFGGSVKMTLQ